jgi:OTU domain-containing protein 3
MGSSKKGNKNGSTKRGGRRSVVAQSVDDGEDQPHDTRIHHRKNSRNQSNSRSCKSNRDDDNYDNNSDEDVQLKRHLAALGLEWIEMNADGNCLFRSLSDQLCGDYGNKHATIREHICNYMEKNKEDFEVFLVYEDEDDHEQQEEDARDFEHYIQQMREDGDWGGHLELMAAARLFR